MHADSGSRVGSSVQLLRREYASNKKLRPVLLSCIEESGLDESAEKTRSELVVRVATKVLTYPASEQIVLCTHDRTILPYTRQSQ